MKSGQHIRLAVYMLWAAVSAQAAGTVQWVKPSVSADRLYSKTFDSAAAHTQVSYLIYIPAEYEKSGDKRYPVIYWLHGVGGGQQGVPDITQRFDAAVRAGKIPPLLIVFVNGLTESMWCDSKDGKTPVETVMVKELIPHIDSAYRTVAAREGRMIEGFSMGGFGAARLGFKYHELFGSVSMLAGALHDEETINDRRSSIFQSVFGDDADYFRMQSPWTLAEQNAAAVKDRTPVRQAVGDRDPTYAYNRDYDAHLTKAGIPHSFTVLPGVGHNPGQIYDALGENNWAFYRSVFGGPSGTAAVSEPAAEEERSKPSEMKRQKGFFNKASGGGHNPRTADPEARERMRRKMQERVEGQGLKEGGSVSDAEIFTLDGQSVRLASLWKDKPLVLVTASITCPVSVETCPSLAALKQEHDPAVNFAILYVKEAHPAEGSQQPRPSGNGVASGIGAAAQPATLAERRRLAQLFAENFSGNAPVYVADIQNTLTQQLGSGPNSALLIGKDGRLIAKLGWYDPDEVRARLKESESK